jgi:hypothetical protein
MVIGYCQCARPPANTKEQIDKLTHDLEALKDEVHRLRQKLKGRRRRRRIDSRTPANDGAAWEADPAVLRGPGYSLSGSVSLQLLP